MNKIIIAGISSVIAALVISIMVWIANERSPTDGSSPPAAISVIPDFNFGAAGDWGCTSDTRNTVNNMIGKDLELVLGLGDYSYADLADCWLKIVDPIDGKMKVTMGNHETNFKKVVDQIMNHFNLTEQYYSFDYRNVHFTVISTERPLKIGSEQYNFVKDDLSKASSLPEIDWMVVYYHKLAYTSPSETGVIPRLRDAYHPLFDKYGVDLVVQAHQHNYQRSYPIRYNNYDASNPTITDRDTSHYNDPEGVIFATVGTGGQSLYDFSGKAPYIVTQYQGYGFLNIDIKDNGTKLIGTFYSNDGTIRDQFSITKSSERQD